MLRSAEEFVRLRESSVEEEYNRAAYEPASEQVWLDVIRDYPNMKEWVVHNKTVPLRILYLLSIDPDSDIRKEVARKRKLDKILFERLSRDADVYVRQKIAYNRKAPMFILKILATDIEVEVREVALDRLRELG